jgi:hypothetical protein
MAAVTDTPTDIAPDAVCEADAAVVVVVPLRLEEPPDAPVADALLVALPLALVLAEARSVYSTELAVGTQLLLAGTVDGYGSVVITTVSAGCEYDIVTPFETKTPGIPILSLSHVSNVPGPAIGSTLYLDGALYEHPMRSSVCWQKPAGLEPAGSQILRQNMLLPIKLPHVKH